VSGLRKSFGEHVVLSGIDLEVAEGAIFALLSPNGAGKTVTVQILSTLIGADGGEVRLAGHDVAREPDAIRAEIGVTGQFSAVDDFLTGEENLILMGDLGHQGRRRAAELLERFDLADAAKKSPAVYSGGMRRRLDLAMTEYIVTEGGLNGQRGFFTRDDSGAVVGIDLAGRLFNRVVTASK